MRRLSLRALVFVASAGRAPLDWRVRHVLQNPPNVSVRSPDFPRADPMPKLADGL